MTSAIKTESLTKYYGEHLGIQNLNLDINEGEVFGLLGPNGAGKTTTIRVFLDFIRPTSGTATVLGLDSASDSVAIRDRVGYLPGDFITYERMTGAQLLEYFASMRGNGFGRAKELAERFSLDLDRKIGELSRGNRQKVGLVQAFMSYPELLILDEPTTGLDPLLQQEFHSLTQEEASEGRTVFISSHVLSEVEAICDRVGIIRDGELVTVEQIDDLKQRALAMVKIEFEDAIQPNDFEAVDGVSDVSVSDHTLTCYVTGSVDSLIKAASKHTVNRIESAQPGLEEVFLAYYSDEGNVQEASDA